jgi:phage antirepressor YoqD-like protein
LQIKEEQMRKWLCNRKIVTARESYDTPMNAKAVSPNNK